MTKVALTQTTREDLAEERGTRIRMARVLSKLSRQEFQDQLGVSTSTLNAWENGRICLTEKGAVRISAALSEMNIDCSSTWLLYGLGKAPTISTNTSADTLKAQANYDDINLNNTCYNRVNSITTMPEEVSLFLENNKNRIYTFISDESMMPYLETGYIVGAQIVEANSYKHLIGQNVLVAYNGRTPIARKLIGVKDRTLFFIATSPNYSIDNNYDLMLQVNYDNLQYIAKILLIRK